MEQKSQEQNDTDHTLRWIMVFQPSDEKCCVKCGDYVEQELGLTSLCAQCRQEADLRFLGYSDTPSDCYEY